MVSLRTSYDGFYDSNKNFGGEKPTALNVLWGGGVINNKYQR